VAGAARDGDKAASAAAHHPQPDGMMKLLDGRDASVYAPVPGKKVDDAYSIEKNSPMADRMYSGRWCRRLDLDKLDRARGGAAGACREPSATA
jgi:hypothetical protein